MNGKKEIPHRSSTPMGIFLLIFKSISAFRYVYL
nr:MAG TPA: hypothetical protein [Caudoviricetes sp.]